MCHYLSTETFWVFTEHYGQSLWITTTSSVQLRETHTMHANYTTHASNKQTMKKNCDNVNRHHCPLDVFKGSSTKWQYMSAAILLEEKRQIQQLNATILKDRAHPRPKTPLFKTCWECSRAFKKFESRRKNVFNQPMSLFECLSLMLIFFLI